MSIPATLNPAERLLCGPGPSNVSPAALDAMQRPMLGHLDPDFHDILTEVVHLLRIAYRASGGLVFGLSATGTSGMEAGVANLVEPGDVAIVAAGGFFGARIADMARRHGAEVIELTADWGESSPTTGSSTRWTGTRRRGWSRWCTPRPRPGSSTRWRRSAPPCAPRTRC